jgi:hypothetical protein
MPIGESIAAIIIFGVVADACRNEYQHILSVVFCAASVFFGGLLAISIWQISPSWLRWAMGVYGVFFGLGILLALYSRRWKKRRGWFIR